MRYKYLIFAGLTAAVAAFSYFSFKNKKSATTFQKTKTGLQFRLVKEGKGAKPQNGQILLLNMLCKTEDEKVLLNTEELGFPLSLQYHDSIDEKDGNLMEGMGMLIEAMGRFKEGDSIIFKLDAKTFLGKSFDLLAPPYGLEEDTPILMHVSLEAAMDKGAFEKLEAEKAATQLQEDLAIIDDYLKENKITGQSTPSGLRYSIHQPGEGKNLQAGNKVKVNYVGRTLDGSIFDTSIAEIAKEGGIHDPIRTYEPLEFELGAHQVIPGLEEGMVLLKKGAKAKFFIPSVLAYGNQAVGKLIKPNANLIFEIEVVDVL